MKYKAVIFDLDGTLIDSMGIWLEVDKEYLIKRNIPVPDDLFQDVPEGNSYKEICQYFKDKFNLPDSIEEIGREWQEMVEKHYKTEITLKSDAHELIGFLHSQNIKLGIGTSNNKHLAETVLQANEVLHYFDCIVAGCEDIKGKPFPDIFLQAAQQLRIDPVDCLVIEDTLHGVRAAHNGGMEAFAIFDDNETHEVEKLKKEAEFYAENFGEILEKLTLNLR
ncbi:MAG: HAD family phosphatase [Candidatus Cloacimonetes bacterium]|nr:HAD family phosphatase [Candidatus Cloacimonadota bacterium]MCF7814676.1 HAD family phosphatase [Candidatus Cloacimonadota bacterium]MCF7868238.1 HAD family phosphatase [Candidatus Cloacimonadota bacterium]MCF7883671.1 HAD family phosphatase [Candidatus Cloacimonadota bacterium]